MSRSLAIFAGNPLNGGTEANYSNYERHQIADDVELDRPRSRYRFSLEPFSFPTVVADEGYQQVITHVAIVREDGSFEDVNRLADDTILSAGVTPTVRAYRVFKPN